MSHITIKYTCHSCGLAEQPLSVPERMRAVDVVYWMKMVGSRAAQDHITRYPFCPVDKLDLIVPVALNATMIGRNSE